MPLIDPFIQEFQHESAATRKILEVCPDADFTWKPHPKSMALGHLASHIADIPGWITTTLTTTVLDFKKEEFKPTVYLNRKELVAAFDKNTAAALKQMQSASDKDISVDWTMRNGDQIFMTLPRIAVLRTWCFNHLYHHRGQLSVFLRLKDIPLPNIYGPTADNPGM
jgi:uncharacterized damage-inducible protein DinB